MNCADGKFRRVLPPTCKHWKRYRGDGNRSCKIIVVLLTVCDTATAVKILPAWCQPIFNFWKRNANNISQCTIRFMLWDLERRLVAPSPTAYKIEAYHTQLFCWSFVLLPWDTVGGLQLDLLLGFSEKTLLCLHYNIFLSCGTYMWKYISFGKELASQEAGVRSPSPVVPLSKEPSTKLMGQCCYRPRWHKNCDCALCNYVLFHAVVSCSHASASPCLVCRDSCVVIVRAFPQ